MSYPQVVYGQGNVGGGQSAVDFFGQGQQNQYFAQGSPAAAGQNAQFGVLGQDLYQGQALNSLYQQQGAGLNPYGAGGLYGAGVNGLYGQGAGGLYSAQGQLYPGQNQGQWAQGQQGQWGQHPNVSQDSACRPIPDMTRTVTLVGHTTTQYHQKVNHVQRVHTSHQMPVTLPHQVSQVQHPEVSKCVPTATNPCPRV